MFRPQFQYSRPRDLLAKVLNLFTEASSFHHQPLKNRKRIPEQFWSTGCSQAVKYYANNLSGLDCKGRQTLGSKSRRARGSGVATSVLGARVRIVAIRHTHIQDSN